MVDKIGCQSLVKAPMLTTWGSMTIFIATLATILLVTKLGAKPKQQPKRVRVKAKKNTIGSAFFKGTVVPLCPLPPS